jgi:phage anti-repressor protein
MSRIDEVKASITSTFGRILKLDSTKKVSMVQKRGWWGE